MFFPAASFGFDLGCALTPWGTDTMAYLNNIFPGWPWVDRYISLLRAIDCTIWKKKCRGAADCTIWKEKCRGAADCTIWKEKCRGAADCTIWKDYCTIWKEKCGGATDCTIWKEKCRGAAILQKTGIHRFTLEKNIDCGVPQRSILGPLLFLLYINDLSTVSESCFSILFADDTNMCIAGKDIQDMCHKFNEDLTKIQEWLCCNELSLDVSKTHYMVFTPKNTFFNDVNVMINNEKIERVYVTKFLGLQIDAQLNWKRHIEYTCKKLSKCIGILAKQRKVLYKSCLINLYYI